MQAVIEQAPVQVKLKAGGGVAEGGVLPEAPKGACPARGKAGGGVDEGVAAGGQRDGLGDEAGGGGQQVEIPDVAGVGGAVQALREGDALEDGDVFGAKGCDAFCQFGGGLERVEGIGGGDFLKLGANGWRRVQRQAGHEVKGERGDPVVQRKAQKLGPAGGLGQGCGKGGGVALLGFRQAGAQEQEQQLQGRGQVGEAQGLVAPGMDAESEYTARVSKEGAGRRARSAGGNSVRVSL